MKSIHTKRKESKERMKRVLELAYLVVNTNLTSFEKSEIKSEISKIRGDLSQTPIVLEKPLLVLV